MSNPRPTAAEIEARLDRISPDALALAEEIWSEDEPTLAEYELAEAILSSDWMRNDRRDRAREARRSREAEAWQEGWEHYRKIPFPANPEFGKNPYGPNDHNTESDRTLAQDVAEYNRLHVGTDGPEEPVIVTDRSGTGGMWDAINDAADEWETLPPEARPIIVSDLRRGMVIKVGERLYDFGLDGRLVERDA